MSGSKIAPEHMQRVRQALKRHGFPSQNALAVSLGLSRSTVTTFFSGKRIAHTNFVEISERLGLDWEDVVYKEGLENSKLDSEPGCIPNTSGELPKIRIKTLLAKSNQQLQVILYEIDEFLTRYPNNIEARLLKDTVKKAFKFETKPRTKPRENELAQSSPESLEEPDLSAVQMKQIQKLTLLRRGLIFLLVLLTTAGLLYSLYILVRGIF